MSLDTVLEKMDTILREAMNKHALVGLAAGIVQGDKLVYTKGLGLADHRQKRPVTMDTIFRIGSISKTFTAIGIMQLWEQGKLQLDDPIKGYLKAYKMEHPDPGAPPITFRHLLTHQSGIGEIREFSDVLRPTAGLAAKEGEHPSLREYYHGRLTTEVYPGTKWAYGNHAFATLGQLVEDISGQPFAQYMIEHVFEPLGMMHSDYLRSERVRDQLATGYQLKKNGLVPVKYAEIAIPGAGSIFSSVNDMAKYVAALLNGGANEHGRVLKTETLKMMMEPQFQLDSHLPGMGLAFVLDDYDGHRIAWHNGGWPGFVSAMYTAPDDSLGVLVFTNATVPAPDLIAADVLHQLLDVPAPVTQVPSPDLMEMPYLWPELCGVYRPLPGIKTNLRVWMGMGGEAEVLVKDNHLTLRTAFGPMSKGVTLYRADADNPLVFKGKVGDNVAALVFKRNPAGQIVQLQQGFNTLYKRPWTYSVRFQVKAALGVLAGLVTLGVLRWARRK